ncbi:acyl-CoA carboxylase epsilon subunit [Kitasatospora sp. NPDC085879]|uniref:acyl-CoA carboxylase epsilon subunit n=1 Tax=Kitasatospora sp. NPDC085879 TaxID=3154769 RepID=UPI000BB1635A|nr:acyl-CoA carboxylase epsilon subunit [Streptomyces sp. TLI_235]PBC79142.1 acyl-CoA carboxylase epsilon subunit-like protein [Streptomyces sp. TLI_235]
MTDDRPPLIRVERGSPTAEELAALTAVLLARAAAAAPRARPHHPGARRRRLGRRRLSYVSPFSWRTAA